MSFVEKMDERSLALFNTMAQKPFSQQAMFFLDSFWDEVGDQAEIIHDVHWEVIKEVDMHHQGVTLLHKYQERNDLDFDMGLYLFEKLNKFFADDKNKSWGDKFPKGVPEEMTAIARKKELRDRVDVNFDGRVSFLEYLLYQFDCSPKVLMERQIEAQDSGPSEVNEALAMAQKLLDEVNDRIREYEQEKATLEEQSAGSGVKALRAKNSLAQLVSGPLAEALRAALITAEAAVRKAARQGGGGGSGGGGGGPDMTRGSLWWMQKELDAKKKKYK